MSDPRVITIAALAAGAVITGALAGPAALDIVHGSAAAPVLPPVVAAPINLVIPPMPTTTTEDAEKDAYRVSPAQAAAAASAAAASPAAPVAPVASSPPSAPVASTTTPVTDSGPAPVQPGSSSDFGVGGINPVSVVQPGPTSSPAPPTTPTTQPPSGTTSPQSGTCTVSMTSNPDADPNYYDLTVDVTTAPQLGNAQYRVTISTTGATTQNFGPYTTDSKGLDSETVKVPTTMMATAGQSQDPLTAAVAFQNNGPTCSASYSIVQVPAS